MKANYRSLTLAGLLLISSPSAFALPLLAENAAQNVGEALTLYPDSVNPNLFYFMPNSSTFAKETGTQLPIFGFTYWGLSSGGPLSEAGAFMNFSMRLASDPSQKAALDKFIRSGRQIAVLPVQSSTVGLTTTKKDSAPLDRLIEEMNFPPHGGRAEDEVGVNAVFTGVGAKVFKAAIDTPGVFKVDYCYKVLGLGPNFEASIEVEMARTYEYFQAAASVGWGFFSRAQIEAGVENLRTAKAIRIHSDGGNATDREYLNAVADQIIQRVFKPELDMKPLDGANGNGGWSFSRYSLKATNKNEFSKETWQLRRRDLVERQFCVPMSLKEIRDHKDQVIRNADL